MEQFAEEQRRRWEANIQKMNSQKEREEQERIKAIEEKKRQLRLKAQQEKLEQERIKKERLDQVKEEKAAKDAEQKQNELIEKLRTQNIELQRQKEALALLEKQIACGSFKLAVQSDPVEDLYQEEPIMDKQITPMKFHERQEYIEEDPLLQSNMTELTELVFHNTTAIQAVDESLNDSLLLKSHKLRHQNYISEEASLSEIQFDLASSKQLQSELIPSQVSRKDQVLFELELKANVQQFRRQLKSKQQKETEERSQLQNEILRHLLKPQQPAIVERSNEDKESGWSNSLNDRSDVNSVVDLRQRSVHEVEGNANQSESSRTPLSSTLNDRSLVRSSASKSVLSVIDNVRRSANLMGKEIADNISESGLLDRDSSIDVHQEMLEMSMRKFNQHTVSFSNDQNCDFDLSADEIRLAELRAVKQAQEEIEMSQSLISNYLTYSNSGATQSYISNVPSMRPQALNFNEVREDNSRGQGRQFFYGAQDAGLSVVSQDFDGVYQMEDQSLVLGKMIDEENDQELEKSQTSVSAMTEHQLLQSENSMVNMAITMDNFTAQYRLKEKDAQNLELQKKKLQLYLDTRETNKPGREDQPGDLSANKYSADEFESDDSQHILENEEEEKEPEKDQVKTEPHSLDRYVISLGQGDELTDQFSGLHQSFKDTSRFGQTTNTDKTIDPLQAFHQAQLQQNQKSEDEDEFFQEFDKPKQRAKWNQESFGKLVAEPAELASTDKSYLFKRKEDHQINPDPVDFTRFNETVKEDDKEVSDMFVAPKRQILPQSVVLDFNDDVDGGKLRKFEEFKKRQALRQNLRQKSKTREVSPSPDSKLKVQKFSQVSDSQISQTKLSNQDRLIIRTQTNAKANLIEESEADMVRVSPSLHQKLTKPSNGLPKLPGSLMPQQMTPGQSAGKRGPQKMSPSRSPASLGTPSVIPKKAFQKQSNSKLIRLALNNVSLAGESNKQEREQVLEIMSKDLSNNYIILFKGQLGRYDYRALYQMSDESEVQLVHGNQMAPGTITSDMIDAYFRYNSGTKDYVQIGSQQLTMTTDAVTLKKEFLAKKQLKT